ncbi:mitogen-activated protein kinase kinase kinase 1 [Phoenix dactylifera]|uniref:Mitogen-activated protein kinase kinase kinase 1 n=1 Tax=Phoenix dactylifera TaxID=42345 RepID=A0A8B7C928_PHODC|nr:mitogen-activated protein kinase kinase kinase 1 [Phoenix dactylifera]
MESVGSNSPRSSTRATNVGSRYNPAQHVADRIIRALRHRLRLLHRNDTSFFILGATGNVYTVTLATTASCTCPDRTVPCKHILFVLLRVLRLSFDDACIWRRTLRPWQLARLLGTPTAPDVLAGSRTRERFHRLFSGNGEIDRTRAREDDGAVCPICLEGMGGGGRLVTCGTCGNSLHGECLLGWRRSRGRSAASCVVCRARWRERGEQERYVNLAGYVSEEDEGGGGGLYAG